jgi:rhodanese-related sulfurtransferase
MDAEMPVEIACRDVHALKQRGEDFLFVDCRDQSEWELVHLDGTQLIPIREIQARAAELEAHRERRIVVHCHHGGRSRRVVDWLRQNGFAKAQNLTGGIDAWASEIDATLVRY